MTNNSEGEIVFPGRPSNERAEWYDEMLNDIVGREKEPTPGGSETWYVIKEIRPAFVSGLYISTIFLCAGAVEQMLFTELTCRDICDQDEELPLGTIIEKAANNGIISQAEKGRVLELKENRIGFFHYRDFSHEDAPSREVLEDIKQSSIRPESYSELHPEAPTMWDYIEPDVKDGIRITLEIGMKAWTDWR